MATSVIDYIFRELAITYLDRGDLAQVSEEDVRHDTVGSASREGGRESEGHSEALAEVHQIAVGQAGGRTATGARGGGATTRRASSVQEARWRGFEGDPCPECGQLTMVRNGTCLKCNSCGATTGCS